MFKETFGKNKKVLIPFIMAGVPGLDESYQLAVAMIEEGAKILELGVPFSDPSADGEVLQRAAEVALHNNVTLIDVINLSKRINQRFPKVPIVLFTYLNPLLAYGLENYVKLATESGVAATLTVDLPIEEAGEYIKLHQKYNLKNVFLASPTTRPKRLIEINKASSAFLYYVSRNGVTGEKTSISATLDQEIANIREVTSSPVAIGFGISTAEQAREVSLKADAVVIGSAYMRMILENKTPQAREEQVRLFTRECVRAIE
jgi:tryptophan synthase alpha chain